MNKPIRLNIVPKTEKAGELCENFDNHCLLLAKIEVTYVDGTMRHFMMHFLLKVVEFVVFK